ncbi:hypothetical protein CHS0354_014755 [Potamilus streckersoni]|uniref:Uncharacterized protein n=1 Tax=Potamilus streckersoni TaxID=2493646 RepID=A0AAE0SPM4_9BIVA|nr:hypothetical protein CHS0354_014755 [Potamilus streckersoni]
MEDEIVDWDCSELIFHDAIKMDRIGPTKKDSIIIGQAVPFTIVFKLSNIGVEKARNLNSNRSLKEFVDNLRHGFRVHSRIMAYNKRNLPAEFIYSGPFRKGRWMYCNITGSNKLGNITAKQVIRRPCLQDGTHFHLPVDVHMPATLGHCDEAEIVVMVSKTNNPSSQMDEEFGPLFQPPLFFSTDSPHAQISASQDFPVGKTFQYCVNIIHPPDICFLHRNCAGKNLLFIQVQNLCKKTVSVENCLVVPDASPKSFESQNCTGCKFKANHHSNLVKLVQQEVDSQSCFPCQLEHGEILSLVYTLQTDGVVHDLVMQALHLVAHLTWRLVGISYSDAVTTYKLPTVNMREIPFVVSPRMKSQHPITAGESFQVIYSITNKLQDFDAVRLYWGPDFPIKGISAKELLEVQNLKKFVICHDPDIQLGYT